MIFHNIHNIFLFMIEDAAKNRPTAAEGVLNMYRMWYK